MLERFHGYTLGTLMAEDAQLIQMVRMVDREREVIKQRGKAERDDESSGWEVSGDE